MNTYTKDELAKAITDGIFSLRKKPVSKQQVVSKSRTLIWVYVSEIFQTPKGTEIPENASPIPLTLSHQMVQF